MAIAAGISGSIPPRAMSRAFAVMSIAMPSTVRSRIGRLGSPTSRRQVRTALELKEETAPAAGAMSRRKESLTDFDGRLFVTAEIAEIKSKCGRQNDAGNDVIEDPLT